MEMKKIKLKDIDLSNKLIIDKNILNGLEDYGIFFIYHKSSKKLKIIGVLVSWCISVLMNSSLKHLVFLFQISGSRPETAM